MKKFNVLAPVNRTGYGIASIGYMKGLIANGQDFDLTVIGNLEPNDPTMKECEIQKDLLTKIPAKVDYSLPVFAFWHLSDISNMAKKFTGPKVYFSTFELNELRPIEIKAVQEADIVGTASTAGVGVLHHYKEHDKTFYTPHAFKVLPDAVIPERTIVDFESSWNSVIKPCKLDKGSLILSSVGKYEARKGFPELLEACKEYGKTKPVTLITSWYNPFIRFNYPYEKINNMYLQPIYTHNGIKVYRYEKFRLILLPPTATRQEVLQIMSNSHYFIAPSRAEGWNLPLFEAMSIGIPTIASDCNGHLDYTVINTVTTIPIKNQVTANDGIFFDGFGTWGDINKQDILNSIRLADEFRHKPEYAVLGSANKKYVEGFSWKYSSQKIQTIMTTLQ